MKFNVLTNLSVLSALSGAVSGNDIAAIYRLTGQNEDSQTVPALSQNDAILNLADEFGVSGFYDLSKMENQDSLSIGKPNDFFSEEKEMDSPKLILIINGVDNPQEFFTEESIMPTFTVKKQQHEVMNHFKEFISEFPAQIMDIKSSLQLNQLSNEIALLVDENLQTLKKLWNSYFATDLNKESNAMLSGLWESLKNSFHERKQQSSPSLEEQHKIDQRILNFINEKSFINELTQLEYFLNDSEMIINKSGADVIINLQSLTSVFKKTGVKSGSYRMSKKIVSDLVAKHLLLNPDCKYDATVIVMPLDQQVAKLKYKQIAHQEQLIQKQQEQQVISLKKREDGSDVFASTPACFSDFSTCDSATGSCSGHGSCIQHGVCWSCTCVAQKNATTGSTTYYTGPDCGKKDVSVEFNLFLWSGIVLLLAFGAGIKLLVSCGKEELPGILVAATMAKKSNN